MAKLLSGDEDFAERLLEALDNNWLIATLGVHADVDSRIVERVIGVFKSHAYSIISHHVEDGAADGDGQVDASRVWLKMRNPHANKEQLSDWAAHTRDAPALSEGESAEGNFFMPLNAFRKWFSGVCICHYSGAAWQHEAVIVTVHAEPQWREKKWPNDYAILTVKHETRVFISANQTSERDPLRPTMDSRYLPMLSLTLWSAARAECIKRVETPLDDGPVNWARNLSVDVTLEAGEYIVAVDALVTKKEAALWGGNGVPITLSAVFDSPAGGDDNLQLRLPASALPDNQPELAARRRFITAGEKATVMKLAELPPLWRRDRDFSRASWNFVRDRHNCAAASLPPP